MVTIEVMMLVNNDYGAPTGRLDGVEFGGRFDDAPFLALGGPWDVDEHGDFVQAGEPFEAAERGRFRVGDVTFRSHGHRSHVGNIFWNRYRMPADEAARLLDHLRSRPGWSREEGTTHLFAKWESGGEFTAEDLTTIPAEAEGHSR